ncbi:uroporphyrinogen-III synthase [Methanobacterium alcaliphilum]|uniref:uroporphyrinogen-III synthase n=1 Tax=Methanobacterium alcaliphilum TaxID=392018 RepID=UPI00200AE6FC|nr:uroporphyrinogen-III synthase [Methanobacterium alcaliphilum]MCK9151640.1 uroporphyrinogen-III synthase [Methanobacterium alcaliphilum]
MPVPKSKKTIAITRPIERSAEAVSIVEFLGGKPLVRPTLELKISHTDSLKDLCHKAADFHWFIFTSPAAVESIFKFCPEIKERINPHCKIAVIGPKTADKIVENGLKVDLLPLEYTAEGLLEKFKSHDLNGKKIGLPRTMAARKVLPDGLEANGADVFIAEAYESIIPHDKSLIHDLIDKILSLNLDAITFTSPLTVKNLFEVAGNEKSKEIIEILTSNKILTASIGPITGKTLEKYGITPIMPPKYTVRDMLQELFNYL